MALAGLLYAFAATAAALPDWAAGTFNGTVKNWCYDDPDDVWNGAATLTVAASGKVSGAIAFEDGASGKASGNRKIVSVSDNEVRIDSGFKWYDEKGKADGSSKSSLVISRSSSGVTMLFSDMDDECPVEGTLAKTASAAAIPTEWQKARTLTGLSGEYCGTAADGIAQLKCGKANKKGVAKVSLTITPFAGKKRSYKAVAVDVSQGGAVEVRWPNQSYSVRIDGDGFFGEPIYSGMRPACSPNAVWSAAVGGTMSGSYAIAFPYWNEVWYDDDGSIAYRDEGSYVAFMEIAAPKLWHQYGAGGYCPDASNILFSPCMFNVSGKSWVFVSDFGDNKPPRITYNPKTGIFSGSLFLTTGLYCRPLLDGERKPKNKKFTLKVKGVYADGKLSGAASYKKFSTPLTSGF
jgi:hypothetical protein